MSVKKIMLASFILLPFSVLAEITHPADVSSTHTIRISKSSPIFTLKLPANPTTGYMWFLKKADANIIVLGHKYTKPIPTLMGESGYDVWRLKVQPEAFVVPHLMSLSLAYAQPWNLAAAKSDSYYVVTQ